MTPGQRIHYTDSTGRQHAAVVCPQPTNIKPLTDAGYILVEDEDGLPCWARADRCEVIG